MAPPGFPKGCVGRIAAWHPACRPIARVLPHRPGSPQHLAIYLKLTALAPGRRAKGTATGSGLRTYRAAGCRAARAVALLRLGTCGRRAARRATLVRTFRRRMRCKVLRSACGAPAPRRRAARGRVEVGLRGIAERASCFVRALHRCSPWQRALHPWSLLRLLVSPRGDHQLGAAAGTLLVAGLKDCCCCSRQVVFAATSEPPPDL